ncbi:MAG: carboxypeptidase regulatory-like domain-containing protein [Bryobacterales bacterium]|nr:carboxypeptidase regulatory-like domain-containing protein [Bryobacterales bacterium]
MTDRNGDPVNGVRVVIESRESTNVAVATQSTPKGAFRITLDRAGAYLVRVTREGFFPIEGKPAELVEGVNLVNVELTRSLDGGTSVDVYANEQLVAEQIAQSQALTEREIDAIPTPRSTKQRIQGATAVLPGVLRSPYGAVHFHGSPAYETNWTLDGFSVSDPASGALEMALGVESVQSVDLLAGRYSAEFGKGTGGAMVLRTRTGHDAFWHRFTNFVPGVDFERGLRFRDWRPRHSLSGPLLGNRAWVFNGIDVLYEENLVRELPVGEDRNRSWSVSNSLRAQLRLGSSHTLSSGIVVDYLDAPKSGLSPLDPMETTFDRRAGRFFFNVKDQVALSAESVLDFGVAAYRSDYRGSPQGSDPYRITSSGRAGSYPIATHRTSSRYEFRANLFLLRRWFGQHQLKSGANVSHAGYFQDIRRSPIEYYRADGTLSSTLSFLGRGRFRESNLEAGAYVQDRWELVPRLVAEFGVRWDRDRIVARGAGTPRISLAFKPPGLDRSRLVAGAGWIPAATNFRIFTRHLDQLSVLTDYLPDGETPAGPADVRRFSFDRALLEIPTTRNLSIGWRQSLPGSTDLQFNYLRKRLRDGYAHLPRLADPPRNPLSAGSGDTTRLRLENVRSETYDSAEIAVSTPLPRSHRWFASYTYSRSWSNAALAADTNNTIFSTDMAGRLSWDVPHRLVSWASFRIGRKTSIVYFAEWRDGFPFSVHDDSAKLAGPANGWRLPRYFSINVHAERELSFLGHRWALRPGVDNLTNRPNYQFANNNVDSPDFLNFLGASPIKLVVRVRWLGRSED